jgi:hypothetical protein
MLKTEFQDFVAHAESLSIDALFSRFEALMYEWAGVADYNQDRGEFIDPRKLAFLEKAYGTAYLQTEGWNAGSANPGDGTIPPSAS